MNRMLLIMAFSFWGIGAQAMEKYPDYLETMAREAEPAVLAQKGDLFAKASEEWTKDRDSYKFDCRRFGDFLAVFIERGANPDPKTQQYSNYQRKYVTSINLMASREIKVIEGHEPDLNGIVTYSERQSYNSDGKRIGKELEYVDYEKKTRTDFFNVSPNFPYIPQSGRQVFMLDPPPQSQNGGMIFGGYIGQHSIQFTTKNYVRPAEDDQIRFNGVNASIFVPAGMGQKIYDQIMKEIAKGGGS